MTKVATTETGPERALAVVHENCVWRNKAGSRWCQWEVVAPQGASFDDLLDPAAWKRIQDNRNLAMRQNDECRIVAFDRSWVVWAFVAHATGNGIVLAPFAETKPQGPREHLYSDDLYEVKFVGNGYGVFRKNDGHQMGDVLSSAERARQAVFELYPKQVA